MRPASLRDLRICRYFSHGSDFASSEGDGEDVVVAGGCGLRAMLDVVIGRVR